MLLRCVLVGLLGGLIWGGLGETAAAQKQKRNADAKRGDDGDSSPGIDGANPLFPAPSRSNPAIENVVRQAQSAYQQQNYASCIDLTTQVLNSNPRHSVARYHRASALIDLGRKEKSGEKIRAGIADAREALGIAGKQYLIFHIPYFYGLTSLAEFEGKPAHAELAIKIATPLLAQADLPGDVKPLVYYQRALARMYLKDFDGAAVDYGEAVKLDPAFQAAHFGRADAYQKADEPGKARAAFDNAAAQMPDDPLVYNNRGTFNLQQGRTDDAIEDFTHALDLYPMFSMAALNRGFARTQKLDWNGAETDYLLSIEGDPKQVLAWRLLGTARVAQGKLKAATEAFTSAISLSPTDADNYSGRAFARFFAKDYAGARSDFSRALELKPNTPLYALWRYAALTKAGQEPAARLEIEAFLKPLPSTPNWHVTLSRYMLGQIDDDKLIQAANDSKEAAVKAQWLCEAHYFQGLKCEVTGKPEEAQSHYAECLKTNQPQLTTFIGARLALNAK